ncbi:hypothetical protein ACQPZZ_00060 [Microbispora sp. CA-135349]|uniref:ATP-binding cassette domain-containing protein n=1 Tax=Microbispora sp. CA-135349 TaxID=3239953 RepID=UPI003D8E2A61
MLHAWRHLHETYLVQEMRGLSAPHGLITEITVREGPGALAARSVNLSVLNLVLGYNGTGKSTLLDLLAGAAQPGLLAERQWFGRLAADIHWFDPMPHTLRLQAQDGRIKFRLDHKPMPFLPAPYRSIVVRNPRRRVRDFRDLAELLGLDVTTFLNLLLEVPDRVFGTVLRVEVINDAPVVQLAYWPEAISLADDASPMALWTVLFESAIALAQVSSEAGPTLLLIDDFGDFLHQKLVHEMFQLLTERTQGFQTVVVTHCLLPGEIRKRWSITSFLDEDHARLVLS